MAKYEEELAEARKKNFLEMQAAAERNKKQLYQQMIGPASIPAEEEPAPPPAEEKPVPKKVGNVDKEQELAEARRQYFIEKQQAAERNRQAIAEQMGHPVAKPTEPSKIPEPSKLPEEPKPVSKPVPKQSDDKEQQLAEARRQYFIEKQQAAERNKNLILEQKGITPAQSKDFMFKKLNCRTTRTCSSQ